MKKKRSTDRKRRSMVALVLAASMALAACGGGDDEEGSGGGGGGGAGESPVSVRAAYVPTATHLPIMVAQDEGIFERNGLEVELSPVQNLATLPGAMGRQFDFGSTTMPDVIKANQQGIEVVLTVGVAQETSDNVTIGVVVPEDSDIREPGDLAGKRVAAGTLGGNIHPSTLFWLQQNGVDTSSIEFMEVPFPNHPDQLAGGQIDAAETLEPFRGQMLAAGARQLVDPMLEVSDPASAVSWMSARSWAEENPDTVAAVTRSLDEAKQVIQENDARAREILAKYSELPPEVVQDLPLPNYSTELPPEELTRWGEVLAEIGQLEGGAASVNPEELIVTGSN